MDTNLSKLDGRGRTWRNANVRRELVDEFNRSGMSAAAFCAARGIRLSTFYNWLSKERKADQAPLFHEVQMPESVSSRTVRICLPNRVEVSVSVSSPAELALVLQEASRCLA